MIYVYCNYALTLGQKIPAHYLILTIIILFRFNPFIFNLGEILSLKCGKFIYDFVCKWVNVKKH